MDRRNTSVFWDSQTSISSNVSCRNPTASTISQSKVKKPVWTESELAGLVIIKVADLVNDKKDVLARRV